MDPAFFGKVVPLAGVRRPPPTSIVYARAPWVRLERLRDGRYLATSWMTNRCEHAVQFGAEVIYVVNDYGDMVMVESWGDQC